MKYNSAVSTNSQPQSHYSDCPRLRHFVRKDGSSVAFGCRNRTCIDDRCRQAWKRKELALLELAHFNQPFNYRIRISPSSKLSDGAKLTVVQSLLKQVGKWCLRNHVTCDALLYPDLHGRSSLHWHGFIRCSSLAYATVRRLLQARKKKGSLSFSFVKLKDSKEQFRYAVGAKRERKKTKLKVASLPKRRLLVSLGKPFFLNKASAWEWIKEGWRIGSDLGCR